MTKCGPRDKFYRQESKRINICRDSWKIDSLKDRITLKVLLQDPKGHYDNVSWPNFFIGITNTGDTVGIISYETNLKFKNETIVKFNPNKSRQISKKALDSQMDMPIHTAHKRKNENDLYCSVKVIYYGELAE
jgi:hypothetical protein